MSDETSVSHVLDRDEFKYYVGKVKEHGYQYGDEKLLLAHDAALRERVEELGGGALHREDRSDDGAGLIPAVEWMLDIIEMYEERLIQFGDPPEKVRSDINEYAKAKARRDLDRARQALQEDDDGD